MKAFAIRGQGPCALHLGCMNFGKRTPEPEAQAIVARALEHGLTVFDTANAYHEGESERIVGRALASVRAHVAIATKVGFGSTGGAPEGLRPERMLRAIDESLERLGTSYVDVYYLHVPDPKTPIEESLGAMHDILTSGRARAWGVSNYASWQVLEMMTIAARLGMPPPVVSQQLYNLLVRQLDVEYFKFTARFPIHTTVYNPLAGGLLTGKHDRAAIRPGSRFERVALYRARYWTDVFFERLPVVSAIAEDAGLSMVELAYAWAAGRRGVDSILVGPGSVEHLEDAVRGVTRDVPQRARDALDVLYLGIVGTNATYAR